MTTRKNKVQALYIHIPFCNNICDYCDFAKLQYFRNFAEKYLVQLEKELEYRQVSKDLKTIYVGGGTPTSLEDDLFEQLLKIIKPYSNGVIEYTFEANPESLSERKIAFLKEYGVNRISIGVETTDDEILKKINRHHTFQDVQTAVLSARKMEIDNLNLDLIIGLPHVNKERLIKDLSNLTSLDVSHISCYSLTVHPNTVFSLKGIEEPKSDYARELYDTVEEFLSQKGYVHYEVSNWAKPGYESKHNFVYWKDEKYYGVGLGAAGYVGDARYTNTRNLTKYLNGEYEEEKEIVTPEDDKLYFLMLNLRTNQGLSLNNYKERFNEDFYNVHKVEIEDLISKKLLIHDKENNKLVATFDGMMILDQIIMELDK